MSRNRRPTSLPRGDLGLRTNPICTPVFILDRRSSEPPHRTPHYHQRAGSSAGGLRIVAQLRPAFGVLPTRTCDAVTVHRFGHERTCPAQIGCAVAVGATVAAAMPHCAIGEARRRVQSRDSSGWGNARAALGALLGLPAIFPWSSQLHFLGRLIAENLS